MKKKMMIAGCVVVVAVCCMKIMMAQTAIQNFNTMVDKSASLEDIQKNINTDKNAKIIASYLISESDKLRKEVKDAIKNFLEIVEYDPRTETTTESDPRPLKEEEANSFFEKVFEQEEGEAVIEALASLFEYGSDEEKVLIKIVKNQNFQRLIQPAGNGQAMDNFAAALSSMR